MTPRRPKEGDVRVAYEATVDDWDPDVEASTIATGRWRVEEWTERLERRRTLAVRRVRGWSGRIEGAFALFGVGIFWGREWVPGWRPGSWRIDGYPCWAEEVPEAWVGADGKPLHWS